MPREKPVPMLCWYRPKPGDEAAFLRLLRRHWPALRAAGLATAEPATLLRAEDRRGRRVYVERFAWVSEAAAEAAHRTPEIMSIWMPMEEVADGMDFLAVEPLAAPDAERSRKRAVAAPRRRSAARRRAPRRTP